MQNEEYDDYYEDDYLSEGDDQLMYDSDEPGICISCSGSGEGQSEDSTCRTCKGKGEV
jgi:DnaJ-class molecular chaperone